MRRADTVITIQKTSKKWKGLRLVGCWLPLLGLTVVPLAAGFVLPLFMKTNNDHAVATYTFGVVAVMAAMVIVGLVITLFANFMKWWHHA